MMQRWKTHVSKAKASKGGRWHFPNAIRKYGSQAFSHKVLEICTSLEEANEAEDAWINSFSTRFPEFGFNLAKGGEHKPHGIRQNPWNNPEFRAKQLSRPVPFNNPQARAANKAALNTPESKAKRSISSKEVTSRPEVLAKISAAAKGRIMSSETRTKISINNKARSRDLIDQINATKQKKYERKLSKLTHKICKNHGKIPLSKCYQRKVGKIQIRFDCKKCVKDRKIKRRFASLTSQTIAL